MHAAPEAPDDPPEEGGATRSRGPAALAGAAGLAGSAGWVTRWRRRRDSPSADSAEESPSAESPEARTTEVPATRDTPEETATPEIAGSGHAGTTSERGRTGSTISAPGGSGASTEPNPAEDSGPDGDERSESSGRGGAGTAAAGVAAAGAVAAGTVAGGAAAAGSARRSPPTATPVAPTTASAGETTTAPTTETPLDDPATATTETPIREPAPQPEPSTGPTVPTTPAPEASRRDAEAAWSARAARRARRRRVLLVVLIAVVAIALVWAIPWAISSVSSWFGGGEERAPITGASAPAGPRAELPRGGTTIFPNYRVVAYYGTPDNPDMGVLGDGPPESMAQKLEQAALAFTTPNRVVQPAMELIVHVADRVPGEDGDYSHAIDEAKAWRYLAVARANRQLLVIDIQPGSSDFLSMTRPWERLLREPDVGLALDPEWRMPPGQVPGEQIGTVTSAEVNETALWLAGLVRENNLPQKLFVVHQFTPNMITEPEKLVTPPELAVVGHVDGFGGPADKLAKYRELARPGHLYPGFKLFYAQDTPVLSPAQTLGLNPTPDFVTYQ